MSVQFVLVLEPVPHPNPLDVRLRGQLKSLLRARNYSRFGFRCDSVHDSSFAHPADSSPVGYSSAGADGSQAGAVAPVLTIKPQPLTRRRTRRHPEGTKP